MEKCILHVTRSAVIRQRNNRKMICSFASYSLEFQYLREVSGFLSKAGMAAWKAGQMNECTGLIIILGMVLK